MSRSLIWKVIFAFVLAVVLAAPAVRAAEPRSGLGPSEPASTSWGLLGKVSEHLTHIWAALGCTVDPSGRCQPDPGASSFTGDNGCVIDPNGRCIG